MSGIVASCILSLGISTEADAAQSGSNFNNPIYGSGADPHVYKHWDSYYYMMYTVDGGSRLELIRSSSITDFSKGLKKTWNPPADGTNWRNIWAPEMYNFDGKWYIYFSAERNNDGMRMRVLECSDNPNPMYCTWVYKGSPTTQNNIWWQIDGAVMVVGNQRYLLWSAQGTQGSQQQDLYIAPMSNPWTLSQNGVKIATPTYDWERVGTGIVEGPAPIIRNGKIYLTYSASSALTPDYAIGMLTANVSSNLLDPASWTKSPQPVFKRNDANGVWGPGGNSFTTSLNGTEDWIVYHGKRSNQWVWDRDIRTQKFSWNADGTPNFGAPVSTSTSLARPAGEIPYALDRAAWLFSATATAYNHSVWDVGDSRRNTIWKSGLYQSSSSPVSFQVNMQSQQTFSKIVLDSGDAVNDYPRSYYVEGSNNGSTWDWITSGTGTSTVTTITFPAKTYQFIKITSNGNSPSYWWGIAELNVYTQ